VLFSVGFLNRALQFLDKPQGKGFAFAGKPVEDDTILGSGIGFGLRKGDSPGSDPDTTSPSRPGIPSAF
jgi:hypothetical protein